MSNKSENKVRVTKLFGGGGAVGWMDPKADMVTDKGTIVEIKDSGRFVVAVSGNGVGTTTDFYPHQLFVHVDQATGVWSYPTGDGAVAFGRASLWPDGVPDAAGTGMAYLGGDGDVHEFSRV